MFAEAVAIDAGTATLHWHWCEEQDSNLHVLGHWNLNAGARFENPVISYQNRDLRCQILATSGQDSPLSRSRIYKIIDRARRARVIADDYAQTLIELVELLSDGEPQA